MRHFLRIKAKYENKDLPGGIAHFKRAKSPDRINLTPTKNLD